MPLPGYSIPHKLTQAEAEAFMLRNRTNSALQHFLVSTSLRNPGDPKYGFPPYGIVVTEAGGYGEISVWFDASGVLHLTDITNMRIAQEIQKPEYHTADESVIHNLLEEVSKISAAVPRGLELGISGALMILAAVLILKVGR